MDISGKGFGRWTVKDNYILTAGKQKKWLCRCSCGTERYVLERSLIYGGSQSCGCLARERALKSRFTDLTGQVFGELTVIKQVEKPTGKGSTMWLCRCSCGNEYTVAGTLLVTGRRTNCPSKVHSKNYAYIDISGQKFGMLTAVQPTDKRTSKGNIIWECLCDCGNTAFVSYNNLMYTNMVSCGCRKKQHEKNLNSLLTHVDGTSIDKLKSDKLPVNNTTGHKGVYFIRNKYTAKIVFQKRAYYLGNYDHFEDAVAAREKAEELLSKGTVEHYEKWQAKAKQNPAWAKENPIHITVEKTADSNLKVVFYPEL